jgi:hypothetical protein
MPVTIDSFSEEGQRYAHPVTGELLSCIAYDVTPNDTEDPILNPPED